MVYQVALVGHYFDNGRSCMVRDSVPHILDTVPDAITVSGYKIRMQKKPSSKKLQRI